MKRTSSIVLLLIGAMLFAGCAKKQNVSEPPVAGAQVPPSATGGSEGAQTTLQVTVVPLRHRTFRGLP